MAKLKIKRGDLVMVIAGQDKGKTGEVSKVFPLESMILVSGVNVAVRHRKQSGKVKIELPIHISNVSLIDPDSKKPTRVGYKIDAETGKKQRVSKLSGKII